MAKTVPLSKLEVEVAQAVKGYTDAVVAAIAKEIDETSQAVLNEIRASSPVLTGGYQRGWVRKKESKSGSSGYLVYNKDKAQLTHVLEHGHAKRGGGRVEGKPHIGPAVDKHVATMPKRIEKILKDGG